MTSHFIILAAINKQTVILILAVIGVSIMLTIPSVAAQIYIAHRQRKRDQASPFWRTWQSIQKELSDTLHHPHKKSEEMDDLLEKLEALTITAAERDRLKVLLRKIVDEPKESELERTRAEFLLFAMPRVVKEREDRLTAAHKS
jgi:hypothetical protein